MQHQQPIQITSLTLQTRMKSSFFIILAVLFCSLSSSAYEMNYVLAKDRTALGMADNSTAKLILKDPNIGLTVAPAYKYKINLKYTRSQLSDVTTKSVWDYTLTLVLKIKDANGNIVGTSPSFNLTLNYQNIADPTNNIYEDVILFDNQYAWLNNPNAELFVTAINSTIIGNVPNDISLEITQIQSITEALNNTRDPLLTKTADNKIISWDYITGAQWYELEWVHIDANEGPVAFTISDIFLYKEPIRIATTSQYFNFHNTYSKGMIYFRIRGVASSTSRTDWFYNGLVYIQNTTEFEPTKNWQATTTYIENGKYKKSIEYADGSLRSRQSQTSMNSDNTVIISETKYDFEGKPVISIMPFPYASTSMSYVANLNTFNVSQGVHQKAAYDNQTGSLTMSTNAGASKYYSALNPFGSSINKNYIPDAQGYPYSQVVYTPDNTGRVAKSSQVGDAFKIFTPTPGNEQNQHFTQNFYASPSSTELYRMFGSNVGQASHYSKTYGVDENGVITISYNDDEGKLVASALSAVPTTNLVSVVDPYNQTALNADGSSTNRLSSQNDIDANAHVSISIDKIVKLTTGNQDYIFNYDLNSSLNNQFGVCLSCGYTLELKITDPDGFPVNNAQQNSIPYYTQQLLPTLNGCTSATYPTVSQQYTFSKIGEYTITKKLYYNTSSIQALTTSITTAAPISVKLDDKTYTDKTTFIEAYKTQKVMEANCGFTCESNCTNYSNSYLNKLNPATNNFYTAAEIATIKNTCLVSCGADISNMTNKAPAMRCDSYKQQMLSQVSPGGCYNTDAFINNAIAQGAVFTPAYANIADLKDPAKFNPAWASTLLLYHIEYCIYKNTCENTTILSNGLTFQNGLNASILYDTYQFGSGDGITGATDWNHAASKGFLRPLNNLSTVPSFTKYGLTFNMSAVPATKLDPFFDTYQQASTALKDKLINYYRESDALNNFDYNGDGIISSTYLSAWEFASCYNRNDNGTLNTTIPSDYNIQRWAIFKGIYLAEKDKIIQGLLKGTCTNGYQDPKNPNTIIRVQPQNFDKAAQDAWMAWANSPDQVSNACSDDVCKERAKSALRELFSKCPTLEATITVTDSEEIVYHIYKYIQQGCSSSNPLKLILTSDITSGYLLAVQQVLNKYTSASCLLSSISVNSPYDYCRPIPPGPNSYVVNGKYIDYIDLINDYLNVARNNISTNPLSDGVYLDHNSPSNKLVYCNTTWKNALTFVPLTSLPTGRVVADWHYPNALGVAITQDPTTKAIQMYMKYSNDVTAVWTGLLEGIQSLGLNLSSVKEIINVDYAYPLYQPNILKCQIKTMDNNVYNLSITNSGTQLGTNSYSPFWFCTPDIRIGIDFQFNPPPTKTYCTVKNGNSVATNPFYVAFDPLAETAKCETEQRIIATGEAIEMWDAAVNAQMQTTLNTHYTGCFSSPFTENFYYTTTEPKQLYYTLYYYDQAGNLIQTVPPEGVRLLGSTAFDSKGTYLGVLQPQHGLLTKYKYNSLNQITYKITPDESGTNRDIPAYTFYNDKGQVVLSQNARQRPTNTFSCVSYDKLGRVSKVGDIVNATLLVDLLDRSKYDQNVTNYWNTDLLVSGNTPTDIVATTYDVPAGADPAYTNRGRITKVSRALDLAKLNAGNLDSYITYQYDIHGNVKTLINAMPLSQQLAGIPIAFTVNYTFDLLSGSVKTLILDQGLASQFIHKYYYDADNRLKKVITSRNSLIWEEDVRYQNYLHGPLARTELGEDRIQGTDYYYTLQQWVKGMNTTAVQGTVPQPAGKNFNRSGITDVGGDGAYGSNSYVAQDEYMMSLGYYSGDYLPIVNPTTFGTTNSAFATTNLWTSFNSTTNGLKGLYNGNIAYWINDRSRPIDGWYTIRDNAYVFKYDQLNRIRNAYYHNDNGYSSDYNWNNRDVNTGRLNDFNASYDLNGNIKTMQRYDGNSNLIDNLTYNYNYQGNIQSGILLDNKLREVTDLFGAAIASYDIDGQGTSNYTYDNIGNLIGDVSEQIANIGWNREGKVTSLTRASGSAKPDFIFKYDVNGKRIYKQIIGKTGGAIDNSKITYTYYAYDGSGNLLATYDRLAVSSLIDIRQVDVSIIANDRVGLYAHATPITRSTYAGSVLSNLTLNLNAFQRQPGYKQYELKDHLGNVRTVVTGIKAGVDMNADGKAEFYVADVVSENDYYPFGMMMNGGYKRNSNVTYKFGYNGKPMDADWNGEGAMYDYGFRIYDPRICRFLSVDPLSPDYPELTTYQFASNTPIWAIDLDGLESFINPFLVASRTGTNLSPVTETLVKTSVETWKWNSLQSVGRNLSEIYRVGREAHLERQIEWWAKEGFNPEVWLGRFGGTGNRADGVKIWRTADGITRGIIRELKPNNRIGRQAGYAQLARYMQAAQQKFPNVQQWSAELELYGMYHVVQSNEYLSTIATRYNTTVEDLLLLNNIEDRNVIYAGETILISLGTPATDINLKPVFEADNTNAYNQYIIFTFKNHSFLC